MGHRTSYIIFFSMTHAVHKKFYLPENSVGSAILQRATGCNVGCLLYETGTDSHTISDRS